MKTATKKPAAKKSAPPAKARRLEEIAESKKGLFAIDPTLLSVEAGFNKRENFGDLRQLADDIAANGLDQPLKIRKIEGTETILIVSGHRRHRAITEILIPEGRWQDPANPKRIRPVDCYSEPKHTSKIDRLVSQICGNTGLPYSLLEKAAVYQEIIAESNETIKPADLARRFGESKQAVSDALRLVRDACPELMAALRKEELAASTAIAIIKQATSAEDQALLLSKARLAALSSAREHIMPKDLPGHTTPPPAPESTTPPPAPESTPPSSDKSDKSAKSDSPSSTFTLYLIEGAPEEPIAEDSPLYHETDRLVLETPDHLGIQRLHLLCAATPFGIAYGYRINCREQLPDIGHIETLDASPEEGFKAMLAACAKHAPDPEDFPQDTLDDLLFDALCRYYPEQGTPEEPKHLAFVATPDLQATITTPTGSANPGFQQTLNAPSGGGNGGGGGGGSTYLDPQTFKCLEKIEKVLEDLADKGKGIEDRVTTADIICGVLRNERPVSDLRSYLTKP